MTSALEVPDETACDLCSQPVDLTAPHVTVVRHIEREIPGEVLVEDATVLSTQHLDCGLPAASAISIQLQELVGA